MAGKEGEAMEPLEQAQLRLARMLEAQIALLESTDDPATVAAVEKKGRAIGVLARSARTIAAMSAQADKPAPADRETEEMDMNDAEPEDIERVYADLQSRLDRLTLVIEQKRVAELRERDGAAAAVGRDTG